METNEKPPLNNTTRRSLLVFNCILLALGNCGGPLIMRLYFLHGGNRVWLSSWLETAGWPIIFIPLFISYLHRRSNKPTTKLFYMNRHLFIAATVIGLLTGLDDYLYAYGVARLPVSTSALIIATQLGFTAGFAFLLVKQKFNFYSINAVVLLSVGAGVLALHTSSDRPKHESNKEYIMGFIMTLGAAALYGFVLPLVELTYKKSKQEISYTLVMEIQLVMCLFATVFCTLGMLVNKDFKVIPREARDFGLGETKYYVVIVWSAIIWQAFFLGAIGVVFCSSSLLSGIIIAVLLPLTEILAVIFYQENFKAEKGVALALSLWGFVSYFYGEIKQNKKKNLAPETEMFPSSNPTANAWLPCTPLLFSLRAAEQNPSSSSFLAQVLLQKSWDVKMLVLFETPAGFALFKVLDEGKLSKVEDLSKEFASSESARKVVKLKAFSKFENTSEALEAVTKLLDSSLSKGLRKFLRSHCDGETLAVADSKLGNAIKDKLKIECVHNNAVMELMRGLRSQLTELISGLATQDLAPMSLGLSHSLSRYKLKFSPDKVDTMIIQAIGLLDDLDKELNTYAMRVREWYGWHFPELAKIIQDNILYAKAVKLMGSRDNAIKLDFSEILPEEIETELKEAAMISMGTEVSDVDLMNIKDLCDQVLSLSEYRAQLYDYLKSRMNTIAPNLTALVGELVGARLIAHGGSLLNLAKQPGSTVQILGAEKALFRALKTKHATPKYGLLFHASLVGQASSKMKGKISRSLAAKAALAIRYDALGEGQDNSMGLENRLKLEARLRNLEGRELGRSAGSAKVKPKIEAYDKDRKKGAGALLAAAKTYNPSADSILGQTLSSNAGTDEEMVPRQQKTDQAEEAPVAGEKKKEKKKKKKASEEAALITNGNGSAAQLEAEESVKKEKKKKRKDRAKNGDEQNDKKDVDVGEKKKKRKHGEQDEETELPNKKDKKKKKKSED